MKKPLITLIVSGSAAAAFAQGTVNWSGAAGLFIGQTNGTVNSPLFGGGPAFAGSVGNTVGNTSTQFYYELLVSPTLSTVPTTVTGLSSWLDTGLEAENSVLANGRILQLNSSTDAVANNWPAGTTENLIMVGWSANLGTTWSTALSNLENWSTVQNFTFNTAFFGIGSSVGTLLIGNANPGITVLSTGPGGINDGANNPLQMDVVPVTPEPGTMALSALGGLSLLAFRRRK